MIAVAAPPRKPHEKEQKMGKFDLTAFKASQLNTAEVQINHPVTGEPTDIYISVLSVDSDEHKKASLAQQNENIKYLRKNRGKTNAERINEETLALLVATTVAWRGLTEEGKDVPFTPENARRIYTEYPFIREQVEEFANDRRNFIKT